MQDNNYKDIINTLLKVQNDRIKGYETAIKNVEEVDVRLSSFFSEMMQKSKIYKEELKDFAHTQHIDVNDDNSSALSGIYRAWMDFKTQVSGYDKRTALEIYEDGEDAAIAAYENALDSKTTLSNELRQLIQSQHNRLFEDRENLRKQVAAN